MRIENNSSQHFGAKCINRINVGKLVEKTGQYKQTQCSFVQLEPQLCPKDLDALEHIAKYWENDKYVNNIYYHASTQARANFYVLTSQNYNYEHLDPEMILGAAEITEKSAKKCFLDYIQVKPNYVYDYCPQFKGVGSAILNSVKKLYNQIKLRPSQTESVLKFYARNGFREHSNEGILLIWDKIFS